MIPPSRMREGPPPPRRGPDEAPSGGPPRSRGLPAPPAPGRRPPRWRAAGRGRRGGPRGARGGHCRRGLAGSPLARWRTPWDGWTPWEAQDWTRPWTRLWGPGFNAAGGGGGPRPCAAPTLRPRPRRPAAPPVRRADGETPLAPRCAWPGGGRRSSAGAPLRADRRRRCGGGGTRKKRKKKTAPQSQQRFSSFFRPRRGGGIGFFRATRSNAAHSRAHSRAIQWPSGPVVGPLGQCRMAPGACPGPARGLPGACPGPVRGLRCPGGPGWNVSSFFLLFSFARGADAARPIGGPANGVGTSFFFFFFSLFFLLLGMCEGVVTWVYLSGW